MESCRPPLRLSLMTPQSQWCLVESFTRLASTSGLLTCFLDQGAMHGAGRKSQERERQTYGSVGLTDPCPAHFRSTKCSPEGLPQWIAGTQHVEPRRRGVVSPSEVFPGPRNYPWTGPPERPLRHCTRWEVASKSARPRYRDSRNRAVQTCEGPGSPLQESPRRGGLRRLVTGVQEW